MFFIVLLSSGLGAIGAIAKPGVDLLLTLATTAQAGIFWWLCRRGERSVRFSRVMEGGGLLINMTVGAFLGRYLLAGFARDHALVTAEGAMMADGYVSMVPLACTVERWDGASARAWWSERQAALDGDAVESTDEWRTIAVDGAQRASIEIAG